MQSREEGVRTTLVRNDKWWGTPTGNVTEYVSIPIAAAATRTAALLSGATDLLLDTPIADIDRLRREPRLRVVDGQEIRTIFLEMDQVRDELQGSDIKGHNPFKDRRVRQALYQAIDVTALTERLMRGLARPAGNLAGPGVTGYTPDLDERLPFDPDAAKRLLAEAGYKDGFGFAMDCPNNRYPNDAQVCAAVASMWSRIGVRATVNAAPYQTYFPKIQQRDSSMYMLGYGSPTLDSYNPLQAVFTPPSKASNGASGDGLWNLGYANPAVTDLVNQMRFETDTAKRTGADPPGHPADAGRRRHPAAVPLHRRLGDAGQRARGVPRRYRAGGQMGEGGVTTMQRVLVIDPLFDTEPDLERAAAGPDIELVFRHAVPPASTCRTRRTATWMRC